MIVFLINYESNSEGNIPPVENVIKNFNENTKIGMRETELYNYINKSEWKILPRSRVFAAKKIDHKEYCIEFLILERDDIDSIKILIELIGKKTIRVLNNYCIYFKKVNDTLYNSKNLSVLINSKCTNIINGNNDRAKRIVDSLINENKLDKK